jgi:hypothetical protein
LGSEKKTFWTNEGVLKGADVYIIEQREALDVAILICRVIGHLHISLTDGLALDSTEVDGLRLRVLADDFHNRKSIGRDY